MKKISLILITFFAISSINLNAQSSLVCNVLDKIEEGTLERKLDFKLSYIGFKSMSEAKALCAKMSTAHSDIQSVECTGNDANGSYFVDFKMKKPQGLEFYKGLFIKYGFSHFIINGEKKEVASVK